MNRVFSAILCGLLLAQPVLAEEERYITTSGVGTVEAAPDMATINLGVTQQAKEAGAAMSATSDAVREVLALLEQAGIEPRDVQTDSISLQPLWLRSNNNSDIPPRITGFVARNSLGIRVRDLDQLGSVLDQVVQNGANTFNGLQFSIAEPDELVAAARAVAVKDAMAKAAQLAEAAGVTLGSIQKITEQSGSIRPQMMEMASTRAMSDVPVAAGELSLSAQVTIVFAIED